jgi:hypothetical protein
VLEYESFVNEKLKKNLQRVLDQRATYQQELKEWEDLEQHVRLLQQRQVWYFAHTYHSYVQLVCTDTNLPLLCCPSSSSQQQQPQTSRQPALRSLQHL